MTAFKLYPHEARWWSFNDYGAVLNVMREHKPLRVLEFGPGSSTLALIEGGAKTIDSCEDDWNWSQTYRERLQDNYPGIVTIRPYVWQPDVYVAGVTHQQYDMALIDGPRETPRRPAVVAYCLARCAYVLVPLECNEGSRLMSESCQQQASDAQRPLWTFQTGPLAGAFGLIGPAC